MKNVPRIFSGLFNPKERAARRAIRELHQFSDRELNDLGLMRSEIEKAVRFGHPERVHEK